MNIEPDKGRTKKTADVSTRTIIYWPVLSLRGEIEGSGCGDNHFIGLRVLRSAKSSMPEYLEFILIF